MHFMFNCDFKFDLEHHIFSMKATVATFLSFVVSSKQFSTFLFIQAQGFSVRYPILNKFVFQGLASAVLPNLDNHECLNACMRDTQLGNKFVATSAKCEDNNRKRSVDSDREEEEKTHCATYQHIKHYLDEVSNFS